MDEKRERPEFGSRGWPWIRRKRESDRTDPTISSDSGYDDSSAGGAGAVRRLREYAAATVRIDDGDVTGRTRMRQRCLDPERGCFGPTWTRGFRHSLQLSFSSGEPIRFGAWPKCSTSHPN